MIGSRTGWVGVILGWLAPALPAAGGDTPEQLLATARDGNRTAIQAIRTLECRYERVPRAGTTPQQAKQRFVMVAGKFWRSGGAYRFIEPMGDGTTLECVVRNGRGLWLRKGGRLRNPILSRETLRPIDGTGGLMWQFLLFSHWGRVPPPGDGFYTLQEILEHPYALQSAERLPVTNEIRVELSHGGVKRQEFWFDPKANYLIRKSLWVPAGDAALRWENEVIAFAEPAPAVFVPTTIEHRCVVKEKQEVVIRTIISELKVNHAMPASALRIPGIEGMSCLDLDRDVRYVVDADGNPVGPEIRVLGPPIAPADVAPVPNQPGDDFPLPPAPAPAPAPAPWWVWAVIILAFLFATAFAISLARRRTSRGEADGW